MMERPIAFTCSSTPARGITLTELVLAMAVLAFTFIPIMGALTTSIKGTMKDERVVQAINLAQTSLNTALQFPFDELASHSRAVLGGPASGPWTFGGTAQPAFQYPVTPGVNGLILRLGQVGTFTVDLAITDEPVQFTIQTYSPASRAADTTNDPTTWNWSLLTNYPTPAMTGVYHRYVLTVAWQDRQVATKTYCLASFKAKLVE